MGGNIAMTAMNPKSANTRLSILSAFLLIALLCPSISHSSSPAYIRQKIFSSPKEAVDFLAASVKANDEKGMLAALGPAGKELISSGDEVEDRRNREKFINSYEEMNRLEEKGATTLLLHIGKNDWTMPIPIVKRNGKWLFDTHSGKQEILNRRIGRNELRVMETLHAYVNAQHEYAVRDCAMCGKVVFAQRLISSPGKRDGLYWEAKEGEKASPLGPLVANADKEGYDNADLSPFHGYYFRILKGQGRHAEGGAYSYLVNGEMILGFAMVAWPAEYGNSGVMTFIVNQKGDIHQKSLGKGTKKRAEAMKLYDPDKSWKKADVGAKEK
jgi:hypothetical protein